MAAPALGPLLRTLPHRYCSIQHIYSWSSRPVPTACQFSNLLLHPNPSEAKSMFLMSMYAKRRVLCKSWPVLSDVSLVTHHDSADVNCSASQRLIKCLSCDHLANGQVHQKALMDNSELAAEPAAAISRCCIEYNHLYICFITH